MSGKGTHTAVPHIISLFETARHAGSSLYISSWDITRAFDSLGREVVMMAMMRLHVPDRLANYMTGIDKTGTVYVNNSGKKKISSISLQRTWVAQGPRVPESRYS